jgi:hypothetical protein
LTLDSWVDSTQLTGANTEEEIIKRGFKFEGPTTGFKFTVGSIKADQKHGAYSSCLTEPGGWLGLGTRVPAAKKDAD